MEIQSVIRVMNDDATAPSNSAALQKSANFINIATVDILHTYYTSVCSSSTRGWRLFLIVQYISNPDGVGAHRFGGGPH